jgi:hypothetical protein
MLNRLTRVNAAISSSVSTLHHLRSAAIALVIAAGGSLVVGGATSLGQQYLPPSVTSFANSAGGWSMLAFLLVWLGRARPWFAWFLGIVAFEGLVEGYGIVSAWRGYFYEDPFSGIFSLIGLLAGPLIGVAASLARYGNRLWSVLAVTPLSAVLLGEGVWGLRTVLDSTSPVYWTIQIVLAAGFLAVAIVARRAGLRISALAIAVTVVGALLFSVLYSVL